MRKTTLIFLVIIILSAGVRFYKIGLPILEVSSTRQCLTAYVARNFYKDGFDIMYPRLDCYGDDYAYYLLEFPFLEIAAASLYNLKGSVEEWMARLCSILFFLGAAWIFWRFVLKLFDEKTALIALGIFCLSPLSVLHTRTVQPESVVLFFSILSLFCIHEWLLSEKKIHAWLAPIACMMMLLSKGSTFYIAIPILYLFYKKYGWVFFKKRYFWIYSIFSVILPFLWYFRARQIFLMYPAMNQGDPGIFFDVSHVLTLSFWQYVLENIFFKLLTPLGFILWILSLFSPRGRHRGFMFAWLAGVALSFAVFSYHTGSHRYYMLPLLPVASIMIAQQAQKPGWGLGAWMNKLPALKICLIILTCVVWTLSVKSAYKLSPKYVYALDAARYAKQVIPEDDLILSTKPLYYADRRGWRFIPDSKTPVQDLILDFENYIRRGVTYFLVNESAIFDDIPLFKKYLEDHHERVDKNPYFSLYKLKRVL